MPKLLVPDNTRSGRMCRRDCSGLVYFLLLSDREWLCIQTSAVTLLLAHDPCLSHRPSLMIIMSS